MDVATRARLIRGAAYGAFTLALALQVGAPKNLEGWIALIAAAFVAAYGKYSTSQSLLNADREEWTPSERVKKIEANK